MINIWTAKSGTSLAVINEGQFSSIYLPVNNPASIELISGKIPPGLNLTPKFSLEGIPEEVANQTEFRFVLRATKNGIQKDRTFSITVLGDDSPEWITPSGLLPVGYKQTLFVLDGSLVNFQLQVIDPDTRAGQEIQYFIPSGGGVLPAGLSLTKDGRITGIIEPILPVGNDVESGAYDENLFDKYPFDLSLQNSDSKVPSKLNQFYQFEVAVSDGDTIATRIFDIFVVGDDFLRADNTIMQVGTGIFTSDNTYIRTPIWLTPEYLGTRRANNNITVFLEVLDIPFAIGDIFYQLQDKNPDGTASKLPPGCDIDEETGEIFGRLPYQSAITERYKFTVRARRIPRDGPEFSESLKTFTIDIIGEIYRTIEWITPSNLGTVPNNYRSTLELKAVTDIETAYIIYTLEQGMLPPGLELKQNGAIIGEIAKSNIEKTIYNFTVKARDQFKLSEITQDFSISIENTDNKAYADVFYTPLLSVEKRQQLDTILSDPFIFENSFIYRNNDDNFGVPKKPAILVFGGLELLDAKQYVASIAKSSHRRNLKIKNIKKARARHPGTRETVYEVIYLDLEDPYDFISNYKKTIKNDKPLLINSLSKSPKSLIGRYSSYVILGQRYNDNNKIFLENFIEIETRTHNYELNLINDNEVESRDRNYELEAIGSSTNISIDPNPINTIKADTDGIKVSATKHITKYFSSTQSLRDSLREKGNVERNFLPLWMRTAQEGELQELGFTLAMPICYCKPGYADEILRRLKFKAIDFSEFDVEIDRFLINPIDSTSIQKQYFVFHDYEFTLK